MKHLPERGRIGIFNRSYYEEVLVVRVHEEFLRGQKLPEELVTKDIWDERLKDIRHFENYLNRNGTLVCKFFLNVSPEEQQKRFLERINNPAKHWKFAASDVQEREFWSDYMRAYEECLSATSTKSAPWFVIPADHKWVTRALVAAILTETIKSLDLKWPKVTDEQKRAIKEAKLKLEKE